MDWYLFFLNPLSMHTSISTCSFLNSTVLLFTKNISNPNGRFINLGFKYATLIDLKHVFLWSCSISSYDVSYPFWQNLFIPYFKLNVSRNDNLFAVYWLSIIFIIIIIIVASMEVYSIFLTVCEAMPRVYSLCVSFLFVSSPNFIVGYFLICLSIFFYLRSFHFFFPLILVSKNSTRWISLYDLIIMVAVDYV